jgi:hypothetical protein
VTPAASAQTDCAFCTGGDEWYSTLKLNAVAVVPLPGETLPFERSDAAQTGIGALASRNPSSATPTIQSRRAVRGLSA